MKLNNLKIYVETYNLIEGFHYWLTAPYEYAYLRNNHRHMFEIRCRFEVSKEDREIEINYMQYKIAQELQKEFGSPMDLHNRSCEHLAHWLLEHFAWDGMVQATVLEDGYGGATLSR
jgi:hypothetical protein